MAEKNGAGHTILKIARNPKDVVVAQFRYFVEMNSDPKSYARGKQGIFWWRDSGTAGVSRRKRQG